MHVGERIRVRREKLGLSLVQLANEAKIDKGNLSRIEKTGRGFSPASINRIADALRSSTATLNNEHLTSPQIGVRQLPVWDYTNASNFVYSSPTEQRALTEETDGQRYVLTDQDYPKGTFALEISDDSMAPRLKRGMVAIIDPERAVLPGNIVAVRYSEGDKDLVTLRSFRDRGQNPDGSRRFEAAPENQAYRTLSSEDPGVHTVGVLTEHREYW